MTRFTRIFVYGTLLRGQPNHYLMTDAGNGEAIFVGTGQMQESRPLVIATPYNIPFLLDVPGKGEIVTGEVFDVDNRMLEVLDGLEAHPTFYEREVLQYTLAKNSKGEEIEPHKDEAWVYLLKDFNPKMLELTYLQRYDSYDTSHGRPYMERNGKPRPYRPAVNYCRDEYDDGTKLIEQQGIKS